MTENSLALVQAQRALQFLSMTRDCLPALRELAEHPGWEMILHLFVARRQGRTMTMDDLCTLTGTWRPLAVRYVEMLVQRGLVDRDGDEGDAENASLSISAQAEANTQALLCGFANAVAAGGEASLAD